MQANSISFTKREIGDSVFYIGFFLLSLTLLGLNAVL